MSSEWGSPRLMPTVMRRRKPPDSRDEENNVRSHQSSHWPRRRSTSEDSYGGSPWKRRRQSKEPSTDVIKISEPGPSRGIGWRGNSNRPHSQPGRGRGLSRGAAAGPAWSGPQGSRGPHEPREPRAASQPSRGRDHWRARGQPYNRDRSGPRPQYRENNQSNQHTRQHWRKPQEERPMGFKELEEISLSEGVDIIEKINRHKQLFTKLLETPVEQKKQDVFALMLTLVTNAWKTSFKESKKLLLLEICNSKFVDNLILYLMQLPYSDEDDKYYNKYYWMKENEFWDHFLTFCECIIEVSPATAVRKCGSLIGVLTKCCLDGLKERQGFELPEEYSTRMTKISDSLKTCDEVQTKTRQRTEVDPGEPPESFRELSVLPTPEELVNSQPFLRANVVDGSYRDKEHYLDVQFRLLREDCFGPLRDGIRQFMADPKKKKYDSIRVYQNVKFLEPFVSKQKVGSTVKLDGSSMKRFKNVNWAHSKRLLFGSLVLFTKDHCRSFLIGTVLERDEKYLSKGQLPVNIVNMQAAGDKDIYNEESYTMIECEVYFEPYHHVLKVLRDPSFPEHLAMSKYIIDVQKIPEPPAYLDPDKKFTVETKVGLDMDFTVLQEDTWPSPDMLGFDSSQYDAYKLALTHEFAVIQGPPGTGKTFIGVKIAETLLNNVPFPPGKCRLLVLCYTNHALDQFLEALLPVTRSLARIGGRSRNEELAPYNINNLRHEMTNKQRTNRWETRNYSTDYFHEMRMQLKREISELEHAQLHVETLETGVLSYKSIIAYVEECKILENYYKGKGEVDPLKHWLFETVDNFEFGPLLEEMKHQEEKAADKHAAIDEDDMERHNIIYDDLSDDESPGDSRGFYFVQTSFSFAEAEEYMKELLWRLNDIQQRRLPFYKEREVQREISQLYAERKLLQEMQLSRFRAPKIKLQDVRDVSTVPRIERWSLYYKWAEVAMQDVRKRIKKLEKQLQSTAVAYEEARMMVDLSILKGTEVVGMTTSGAARLKKLLIEIAPLIVVVEEAAEVLEAHIVTSLTKSCQHLILIGDHQQLRPSAACVRLARRYSLEVSLFERMVLNAVHGRRLRVQHRMRPALAELICPHIYPDLLNHPSVEEFPPVRGVDQNLFFFTHEHREQCEDDSSSRTNTFEADMALRLANYLMQQGYQPEDVTVLTAYSGQMFYLRRQRSLYDRLSKVKITVLDNYQGEESKIILLSLVRNNSNDSIGFLGTDNRVCVALSRAREGLYIFGNIEMLKTKSPLWSNIAQTLEERGAVGKSLKLKCVNHSEHIITIEDPADFGSKVPEGGCLVDCLKPMPCGHACPRVCHAYDPQHATITCTQDCDRKICDIEGHKCPLRCSLKCPPCHRIVEKSLPCGHNKEIPCHKKPDDSTIYCAIIVSVTLPDCHHEVKKECSQEDSKVRCTEECRDRRLACGHACVRTCHVAHDPHHERYTCMKPCPKAKKGCTAKLEGDLGKHKCLRICFEDCIPCNVQVSKKRSGCRHSEKVECHVDVDATPCRNKCARALPCSHFCKKLCFQKCGDCRKKVKKLVPGCNHEIEIECGKEPTSEMCYRKCERELPCGHACPGRCDQPCSPENCKIGRMDQLFDAPCGHKVQLPCNLYKSAIDGDIEPEKLLTYCKAPCGVVLRCGHICGGSCVTCRRGSLHVACAAACHQLNICGHRCSEPCNQVCPPCPRRCEVRCEHSPCGRLCGAPCTPCAEPCKRACEHSACGRVCGEPCDRAPCSEPCPSLAYCGLHPCRGLCGEPCPKACRQCDPDNFPTDLLGDPYADDDKLVQLQDCPHIMDLATLDGLMSSQSETVQIKTCPFCRQPIINTHRYKDRVNRLLKHEINPIKEKVYGTDRQRQKKKYEMGLKIKKIVQKQKNATDTVNVYWRKAFLNIFSVIKMSQKDRTFSLLQLDMNDVYLVLLETVGDYCDEYRNANTTELHKEFLSQVKLICEVLAQNARKISQQQQVDIGNELRRTNSMVQLAKILSNGRPYLVSDAVPDVAQAAKAAHEAVFTWGVFNEDAAVESLKKLEAAVKLSGIASKEERDMVVRAIGLKAGHWFKCPNGHFYCIGECGGAMQLGRCPDCGAAIGGGSHRLTAGNSHAGEMDGSRYGAWSQEMNHMANFRLNHN